MVNILSNRHALGRVTGEPRYAGFQLYTVAYEITTAPIPDSISYEQAVVLPLAINPKPTGKTILIWGGSSSVGSTTIQLAVGSGLEVVSTAGKKNLDYVKSLGAKHVFDHSSATVVEDVVTSLRGSDFVGAFDAISLPETLKPTADIVHQLGGGVIATVQGKPVMELPSNVTAVGGEIHFYVNLRMLMILFTVSSVSIAVEQPEVGDAVWRKYVPEALRKGQLLPKPDPILIKGGLHHIQEGLDTLKRGVSAAKVVVEL
jgi:NADPH:quinone reductase-like Zn-dependent oxidoreductase